MYICLVVNLNSMNKLVSEHRKFRPVFSRKTEVSVCQMITPPPGECMAALVFDRGVRSVSFFNRLQ